LVVPVRDHRGFTLVELLVALVISGIITGAIFQALLNQGRFSRLQSAREEVQDNSRAALETITGELRGIGVDAISAYSPQSITFRTPRIWGVVCGYAATGELNVLFASGMQSTLRAGQDSLAVPLPSGPATWQFHSVTDVTHASTDVVAATTRCNTALGTNPPVTAAATPTASRVRAYSGAPSGLAAGEFVYLYERVSYSLGTAAVPGTWILRNDEPLAGPIPADGGLQLVYFTAANTNPTNAQEIRSIRVVISMNSTAKFGGASQRTSDSTVIYLRNRN
jgi:prepilin-type N-terminal cleavage/methylation domain-containing protein